MSNLHESDLTDGRVPVPRVLRHDGDGHHGKDGDNLEAFARGLVMKT